MPIINSDCEQHFWCILSKMPYHFSILLALRRKDSDTKPLQYEFPLIEMSFNLIQFIKRCFCPVSWGGFKFVENICKLSRGLCASMKVSRASLGPVRPRARLYNHPANGPVPNSGCLSSTTFTSMLENFTNTHLVLFHSMLSRFSCLFSCSFNHLSTTAKVFIQGEPLCCL